MLNTTHIIFISDSKKKLQDINAFIKHNDLGIVKKDITDIPIKEDDNRFYSKYVIECSEFSNLIDILKANNVKLTDKDVILYRYINSRIVNKYNDQGDSMIAIQNINGLVNASNKLKSELSNKAVDIILGEISWDTSM